MKKTAFFMALLLSLGGLLVSCEDLALSSGKADSYLGFEGYYRTDYQETWQAAGIAAEMPALRNCALEESQNNVASFVNANPKEDEIKYAVFNTETGSVIYKLTKEAPDEAAKFSATLYDTNNGYSLIRETKVDSTDPEQVTYTYTLYTAKGAVIVSKTFPFAAGLPVYHLPNGLIAVDDQVYSVKDDTATYLFDLGLREIPDCDVLTDTYNYKVDADQVLVYNQAYELVTAVYADSNADETAFSILNNGDIFVQNVYRLLDEATEYDIARGIEKYNLSTYIYRVENRIKDEVKLDFVILTLENRYTDPDIASTFVEGKVENVALIAPIDNKTVDATPANLRLVDISNDLKIHGRLADEIDNQAPELPVLVADNRFVVSDVAGREFLINETGEVIGEISGRQDPGYVGFESVFVDHLGKIYNADLGLVLDVSALDYQRQPVGDFLLFLDEYEKPVQGGAEGAAEHQMDIYLLTATGLVKLDVTSDPDEINDVQSSAGLLAFELRKPNEAGTGYTYETVIFNELGRELYRVVTSEIEIDTETYERSIDNVLEVDGGVFITVTTRTYNHDTQKTTFTTKTYFCQR